jgi:hypothetical protein
MRHILMLTTGLLCCLPQMARADGPDDAALRAKMPPMETKLHDVFNDARTQRQGVTNQVAIADIDGKLSDVARLRVFFKPKDWIGRIADFGAMPDGSAWVEVDTLDNIAFGAVDPSNKSVNPKATFPRGSQPFKALAAMMKGQAVKFSAKVLGLYGEHKAYPTYVSYLAQITKLEALP